MLNETFLRGSTKTVHIYLPTWCVCVFLSQVFYSRYFYSTKQESERRIKKIEKRWRKSYIISDGTQVCMPNILLELLSQCIIQVSPRISGPSKVRLSPIPVLLIFTSSLSGLLSYRARLEMLEKRETLRRRSISSTGDVTYISLPSASPSLIDLRSKPSTKSSNRRHSISHVRNHLHFTENLYQTHCRTRISISWSEP